jgi:hypothetical protein
LLLQDIEFSIKGRFDAVLDTIGGPETERIGVCLLKKGGHYMTLQVIHYKTVTDIGCILADLFAPA